MMLYATSETGWRLPLILRDEMPITDRHFRHALAFASNFYCWEMPLQLLSDKDVIRPFVGDVRERMRVGWRGRMTIMVDCSELIGWESSDMIANYAPQQLRPSARHSTGFEVRSDTTTLLAPLTSCVTISYELKYEKEKPLLVVNNLYPGKPINKDRAWFTPWHPGEIPPV